MQSLSILVESLIIYSKDLSNKLRFVRVSVRAVRAYKILTHAKIHRQDDRLIDSLVIYIAQHPEYIIEWQDNQLLCLVAFINTTSMRFIPTKIPQIIAHILYCVCQIKCYFDFKKCALIVSTMRLVLEYRDFLAVLKELVLNHPSIFTRYPYMNNMWLLTHTDMKNIYKEATKATGSIGHIPREFIDYDMCVIAARFCDIHLIPPIMIDDNLSKIIIKSDPSSIGLIPEELITQKMCNLAIERDVCSVVGIPLQFVTENMILQILREDPELLGHILISNNEWIYFPQVTHEFIRDNIINTVIDNLSHFDYMQELYARLNEVIIERVTEIVNTYNDAQLKIVFDKNPMLISMVDNVQKVRHIIMLVNIKHSLLIFRYIDKEIRSRVLTDDMYIYALSVNPGVIRIIPQRMMNRELCESAVNQDQSLFSSVPIEMLSSELIHEVLNTNPAMFKLIPEKLRTRQMCDIAINSNPIMLLYIPSHLMDPDIVSNFIKNKWDSMTYSIKQSLFSHLFETMKKDEFFINEIICNPNLITEICLSKIDEILLLVVNQLLSENLIEKICKLLEIKKVQDKIIGMNKLNACHWKAIVEINPNKIKLAPSYVLTAEICERAVEKNEKLIQYVPKQFYTLKMVTILYSKYHLLNFEIRNILKTMQTLFFYNSENLTA